MHDGAKVGQTVKLRLSERIKRIELIGKHVNVGAFRDRVEHTGKDGGAIESVVQYRLPENGRDDSE